MLTSCRGLKNKGYSASFVTTSLGRGVRQFSHGLVVTSLRQLHACILPLAGRLQNRTVVPTELRASARRRDLRRTGRRRPHDDLHGEPHYDRSEVASSPSVPTTSWTSSLRPGRASIPVPPGTPDWSGHTHSGHRYETHLLPLPATSSGKSCLKARVHSGSRSSFSS